MGHYQSLMKLLLTEHQHIVAAMVRNGRFVSSFVQEFWRELEAEGWNWEQEHATLRVAPPPNTPMQTDRPAADR